MYVIKGAPPSKSNCYKVITIGGHASIAKTAAVKEYERAFFMQCPLRGSKIDNFFKLNLDVYLPNALRQDIDNTLKVILDCLQECDVITNDNRCVDLHVRKFKDKDNPRIEFEIEEVVI